MEYVVDKFGRKFKKDKEWLFKEGALAAHTSLGRWIRNEWELWEGSKLKDNIEKLGFTHPDDMSNYIIEEYIKYFKK